MNIVELGNKLDNKLDKVILNIKILAESNQSLIRSIVRLKLNQCYLKSKIEKLGTSIYWMKWFMFFLTGVIIVVGLVLMNKLLLDFS